MCSFILNKVKQSSNAKILAMTNSLQYYNLFSFLVLKVCLKVYQNKNSSDFVKFYLKTLTQ